MLMGFVLWPILVHDVDIGVNRDLFSNELQDGIGGGDPPGHHEMPNEQTSFCNPEGIDGEISHLTVHLLQNLFDDLGIIRGMAELFRIALLHELHIGHIDVNDTFEEPNHFDRFVSGTVIDKREPKSFFDGLRERGYDLGNVMGRGDEVDVVTPDLLKSGHCPCQVGRGDGLSASEMADLIILAEDTTEITVSEEDGSRTTMSDEGPLFTKMGKGTGDSEDGPSSAVTNLSLEPVDSTFPGAEPTLLKELLQAPSSL
jgi:hypothetical protein